MPVTVKGQVTIPKWVRDHLGLKAGDRVSFECDESGRVVVSKAGREVVAGATDRFGRLKGRATAGLTADEIMAMTRGGD